MRESGPYTCTHLDPCLLSLPSFTLICSLLLTETHFLCHRNNNHPHRQISLPISPGTNYTLSFSIDGAAISLYMDTGSDLVWLPYNPFECILCENECNPKAIPNPSPLNLSSSAKPTSCKSRACSATHLSSSSDLCAAARCPLEQIEISDCVGFPCPPFYYAYADGSLIAKLYTDSLSIPTSSPSPLVLRNFTFGCAHSPVAEPIGVAGFWRGVLSLPAQLASFSPQLGNQFSYCLVSHEFEPNRVHRPSPLILGCYQKQLGKRERGRQKNGYEERKGKDGRERKRERERGREL